VVFPPSAARKSVRSVSGLFQGHAAGHNVRFLDPTRVRNVPNAQDVTVWWEKSALHRAAGGAKALWRGVSAGGFAPKGAWRALRQGTFALRHEGFAPRHAWRALRQAWRALRHVTFAPRHEAFAPRHEISGPSRVQKPASCGQNAGAGRSESEKRKAKSENDGRRMRASDNWRARGRGGSYTRAGAAYSVQLSALRCQLRALRSPLSVLPPVSFTPPSGRSGSRCGSSSCRWSRGSGPRGDSAGSSSGRRGTSRPW